MPDIEPRERLGRYLIRETVGSGIFATVYRAFDPLLERDVILKVYHEADILAADERDRDHFVTEAKALAQLRYPWIVPIYDAGWDRDSPYIAMAWIEGRTLASVGADRSLDLMGIAAIISQVAETLAYAHAMGVVHRDVKPSNIVVDEQGNAHVIDFGLAQRVGSTSTTDLARRAPGDELGPRNLIRGTPAYLAPEQAHGDDAPPIPANDQYSLGVVLYELLCGRPPFLGTPVSVLVSALQEVPPPPRRFNPRVPASLEAICLKAMAKHPADRYRSCHELSEVLRAWIQQQTEPRTRDTRPVDGWGPRLLGTVMRVAAAFL